MRVWSFAQLDNFSIHFCSHINWSHVFAVFDKDHDGTIDFYEFLLAIASGSPGDLDSHLNYVFEMWKSSSLTQRNSWCYCFYIGVMFQAMVKWTCKN